MSTQCDHCGSSNSPANNFCATCGAKIAIPVPSASNRKFWIGVLAIFGLGSVLFVSAIIHASRRQVSERLGANQPATAQALSASSNNTPATSTELTPAFRLSQGKVLLKASSEYSLRNAREHFTAIPQTAPEYKEAQRLLKEVAAAEAQFQRKQAPIIREELRHKYELHVAYINPHLNYIGSKITKTKGGYALWATHEFFTQYTFSAGKDAQLVQDWIGQHREELQAANIVRVGVMGRGGYASWSYFDLK